LIFSGTTLRWCHFLYAWCRNTSCSRLRQVPARRRAIPTAVGVGSPAWSQSSLWTYSLQRGIPKVVIEQYAQSTRSAMVPEKFQQRLIASGLELLLDSSPNEMRRIVDDQLAHRKLIIKAIGLKLD
jgi:tripartite-type tricarboxylate transporter receptor subunit TctC